MATIDNVDFGIGHISPGRIPAPTSQTTTRLFAPDHQQAWLVLAHPRLPFRIGVDIGAIVVEQIALNLGLARLIQKMEFLRPQIRIMAFDVRIVSGMT